MQKGKVRELFEIREGLLRDDGRAETLLSILEDGSSFFRSFSGIVE